MSDKPQSDDKTLDGWVMPEPVFRTTPGHTPKSVHLTDPADEIPTAPGFSDDEDTIDTLVPGFVDVAETAADAPIKVTAAPPKPKKSGCARSFLTVVSLVALAIIGVVAALVYFLFYYKATDTGTF